LYSTSLFFKGLLKGIAIITTAMRRAGVKADYRTADKTIMGITYKHKKGADPKT
ncbi:hypothetical protein HMPREF1989_00877, partial [Porphyromonas gingivalis F0566]